MGKGDKDIIEKEKMKKKPPAGVKLISIYLYINAGIDLNYALGKLVGGRDVVYKTSLLQRIVGIHQSWILLVIWDFIWCGLFILMGRGIWKGINFVRYMVVVFGSVGIIMIVVQSAFYPDAFMPSIFISLVRILIAIAIIYYLLNKNAVKYFKNVKIKDEIE